MDVSNNNINMKVIEKSLKLIDLSNISHDIKKKIKISPTAGRLFQCDTLDPLDPLDISDDESESDIATMLRTFWVLTHLVACFFIIIHNGVKLGWF